MRHFPMFVLALFTAVAVSAEAGKLRDNSILVEEAYNQPVGVVQNINLLELVSDGGWAYSFRQEWPFKSTDHQLAYSVPVIHPHRGDTDLGDVGIHYRYQLMGGPSETLWVAPRATIFLPTGDSSDGTGTGALGYQVGVPVSLELYEELTIHANGGMTYVPSSEAPNGAEHDTLGFNMGAGAVYYLTPTFNALLEFVGSRGEVVTGTGGTKQVSEFFFNPGLRFAADLPNGMRLVPALSYYFGVGSSHGEDGLLAYLSIDYAFR